MSLFGSGPTMIFDGAAQPTKPGVEAGRPADSDAKSKKARKAKNGGKKDEPASVEKEPSSKKAKVSGTPAAATAQSPSVPKRLSGAKKRGQAAAAAANAAADAAAGGALDSVDSKKPNRKQRAAGDWAEINARTVFVGNLPVDDDSHQKKLRRHFAPRHRQEAPCRLGLGDGATRLQHIYIWPPGGPPGLRVLVVARRASGLGCSLDAFRRSAAAPQADLRGGFRGCR